MKAFEVLKTECLKLYEGMEAVCRAWSEKLDEAEIVQRSAVNAGTLEVSKLMEWQKKLATRKTEIGQRKSVAKDAVGRERLEIIRVPVGEAADPATGKFNTTSETTLSNLQRLRTLLAMPII